MAKRDFAPDARAIGEGVAAVYLPIDALRPNPRNPRLHGAEIERLARTILRTTWGAPILAQTSTRRIIGGHGRLEAARMIAAGMVVDGIERGGPMHRFDRDAPAPLLLPVRLVDVSDAEADAMTLADNARALQGTDDAAAVVAMATASFDRDADVMRDMGYGAAELDALVRAAGDAVLKGAPTTGEPVADLAAEWEGMPEYESEDHKSHRHIVVHFASDEDFDRFAELTGATFPGGSKSMWFPPRAESPEDRKVGCFSDREYVSGE